MVKVIAHRGWWKEPYEQNTLVAFKRAFDAGIGVELDVRDWNGKLVVSHDPPVYDNDLPDYFSFVLELLGDRDNILAVNVKSCGLAPLFARLNAPKNWFFFDLPPHEMKDYCTHKLPCTVAFVVSKELFGTEDEGQWMMVRRMAAFGTEFPIITDKVEEAIAYFR